MDLAQYEQKEVCDYVLTTPSGDKLDVVFQLAGPNHPKRKERDRKRLAQSLRKFNKSGRQQLEEDPDELVDRQTDTLVSCTLGWKNLVIDGEALPYSDAAARKLYEDPRFEWVRGQVTGALNDISLFIPGSSRD